MSISQKQLQANKINSKKWGVKTKEWKLKVSKNTVKHWLNSHRLINDFEWTKYRWTLNQIQEEYWINWVFENTYAERIAFYTAKMFKANEIEEKYTCFQSMFNKLDKLSKEQRMIESKWEKWRVPQELKDFTEPFDDILESHNLEDLERMQKYTIMIENRLYKAMKEFMKLKGISDMNYS